MKRGSFLIPSLLVAAIVMMFIAISCSKSNGGKPTLTLESISSPVLHNDSCRIKFKFTGGASVSGGSIWLIRHRTNMVALTTGGSGGDTIDYQLPTFSRDNGEIYWSLPAQGYLSESLDSSVNDTFYFQFWVQNGIDSAGNAIVTSDTVVSPKVVVFSY